ncbi:WHG domain-containing protein [Dactylosporangium sp. NPDC051484]|uniref:TetR/AcrR family transcriptional regulator n=1 Tax=Dactylosporangium sp. NPDC051484 TaxID=3154942 RepID=UPI00344ECD33
MIDYHWGRYSISAMPRKPLSRDRVISCAAVLVDRDGLDALSLTAVAHEMSVGQSALYNHVDGVDDVRRELALLARRMLADALRDAALGRSCDDAVMAMAQAWRAFVAENRGLYAATDRVPMRGDAQLTAAVEGIVSIVRAVIAGYGLPDQEAMEAAWAFRSAVHGFCVLEADRGQPAGLDLDHAFQRLVVLLCSGMKRSVPAWQGSGP